MPRSRALRPLLVLVPSAIALLTVAWSQPARACTCVPTVWIEWPTGGSVMAANDLLLVRSSCDGELDELQVTLNGQPASLVASDRLLGQGVAISPEPSPGTTVRIENADGEVELEVVVGGRDEVAPAAPELLALDHVLVPEAYQGSDCASSPEPVPARDWTLELEGQAADEDLLYHVTLGPEGSDGEVRTAVATGMEEVLVTLRRFEEDAGKNVCATVRTFDMAGNEGEEVQTCYALDRRDTLDGGCACSTGSDRSGWAGAGLMLLLGGWARRRRGS